MSKAKNKTTETDASVDDWLDAIDDPERQRQCRVLCDLMADVTNRPPKLWGSAIVGFGRYHYKYESGREGEFMLTGFANRKQALTLYIMAGFSEYDDLLARLGPHKTGKSCLYVKRLDDIDFKVLRQLVRKSVAHMRRKYETD